MRIYGIPFRERCILKKHLSIIYVSFAGCRFLSVLQVFFGAGLSGRDPQAERSGRDVARSAEGNRNGMPASWKDPAQAMGTFKNNRDQKETFRILKKRKSCRYFLYYPLSRPYEGLP
jgi:hypothetical protein